jgi:phosphoribosylaminoimidazolecarboxamide formyltransferase / IMP cyclohydrolase
MPNALLSVYNKTGIADFASQLIGLGWKIYSSGGTAKELGGSGIEVTDVATIIGGGQILGHRVVTLSRQIHAGLLSRDTLEDDQELVKLNIPKFDLVCVDLYPLEEEIKKVDATKESVIELTDIGGPTLLRSAAKGRRIVICDPGDRQAVIDWLKGGQENKEKFIDSLAAKAEFIVSKYCLSSANFQSQNLYNGILGERILNCQYGENKNQKPAGLYKTGLSDNLGLYNFKLITGLEPSYNNLADLDRLLQTITHIAASFDINRGKVPFIAIGVKHGNPCGAAVSKDKVQVIQRMIEGDELALFGGSVMINFDLNEELAEVLLTYHMQAGRRLLDTITASSFTDTAVTMLKRKGDKCRLMANPALAELNKNSLDSALRFRYVRGGFLSQPNYTFVLDLNDPELEKIGQATVEQENDLLLAKAVCDTSNSNTVTIVKDGCLIGNGVGQQARVRGAQLAVSQTEYAKHEIKNAVASSDSFFPFTDGPEVLIKAGIKAIISTSGSVRDEEVKELCQKNNVILYLIPDAKARGFFGH